MAALRPASAAILLQYTDPWTNAVHPLAGGVVLVYSATGQKLWTSQPSDASGSVSTSGVVPTYVNYGTEIYITVSASNSAIRIIQHQSCFTEAVAYVLGFNASLYPVAVHTTGNALSGETINVGDGYIPTILETGTLAHDVAASKFGISPGRLDVYWDPCLYAGTGWPHFNGLGGTWYEEIGGYFAGTNITLRPKYMYDLDWTRQTMAHEYGHYVHFLLNGSTTLPGNDATHYMDTKSNTALAFTEGWAEFFSEYTIRKNGLPWTAYLPSLEFFPQSYGSVRGTDQEGHVAAFFWDMLDADVPNGADETVSSDWLRVKQFFGTHPSNIQQFHDAWMNSYQDDAFEDLYKKTFFYGMPGYMPPIPARHMVAYGPQVVNGSVVTKAFAISATETTQGEYYDVMKSLPSKFTAPADFTLPAESMSWLDAILYCNALSDKYGYPRVYTYGAATYSGIHCTWLSNLQADLTKTGFRLPTRAEWTWAYQAGTTTPFYWGTQAPDAYAWYSGNSGGMTHPVGGKVSNNKGLYDIAGNVMEWVWDGMPATNFYAMGGSYQDSQTSGCKIDNSSTCNTTDPGHINPFVGFRVVRTIPNLAFISLLLQ